MSSTRTVPLLVTHDLELAPDHDADGQRRVLDTLIERLARTGTPTTAFTTASAAEAFPEAVRALAHAGHEIGCHGLHHGCNENLRRASADRAASLIAESTLRLARAAACTPRCFRGPFSSTSAAAQRALVERGYGADFSVCSGRLDFPATRGGTFEWLLAPRMPYQPSHRSPFRRGDLPLWVVPLSARGLPFLSGVMYLAGLGFTRRLFDALHRESIRTGKPIVFLFHSYEFAEPCARRTGSSAPRKRMHRLYEQNRNVRLENLFRLFDHMQNAPHVTAMTASEYISRLSATESEATACTRS